MVPNLTPGVAYCRWHGQIFSNNDRMPRLDQTCLYTVCLEEEVPIFRRIHGYRNLMATFGGHREERTVFTTGQVVRITEGRRKGIILTAEQVSTDEETEETGISLNLRDKDSLDLREHHFIRDLISQLESDLEDKVVEKVQDLPVPDLYLCTRRGRGADALNCRKGAAAWVKNKMGKAFRLERSLADNVRSGSYLLSCPGAGWHSRKDPETGRLVRGDSRDAFPYEFFYGRGVLVADPGVNEIWYEVPLVDGGIRRLDRWIELELQFA